MLSVIIATRNSELLNQLTDNIQKTIGIEFELIAINGINHNRGICHIYNQGAARAKFPFLCFIHEDILFHTDSWGQKLINHLQNKDIALVGVLGATIKTKSPSEVFLPVNNLTRVNQLQRRVGKAPEHYCNNPNNEVYSEVKALDGMFLACTKTNHLSYPFDEHVLTGFHGYDIDFSLGQATNGKIIVVYDILLEHFSSGGHSPLWVEDQLKLKKKWEKQLPSYLPSDRKWIRSAEINNTEVFLLDLITHRYNIILQLIYLLKLLALRPLSTKNLYFVRKFLIQGAAEEQLKKSLNRGRN
jgi:glycosyltransferase involved in cell wall biosynthesis